MSAKKGPSGENCESCYYRVNKVCARNPPTVVGGIGCGGWDTMSPECYGKRVVGWCGEYSRLRESLCRNEDEVDTEESVPIDEPPLQPPPTPSKRPPLPCGFKELRPSPEPALEDEGTHIMTTGVKITTKQAKFHAKFGG